jgi:hypothetical protein
MPDNPYLTPDQNAKVDAAKTSAWIDSLGAKEKAKIAEMLAAEADAKGLPRVFGDQVIAMGVPGAKHTEPAQLAEPDDYPEGMEPDAFLPFCAWPRCKNRAKHKLMFTGRRARRPAHINARGQIEFGPFVPVPEDTVSSIIGPSAFRQVTPATQMPSGALDLCQEHFSFNIPYAPEAPHRVYTSGPYSSLGAEKRAQLVERMTGRKVRVFKRKVDGVDRWFCNGDDPNVPGHKGKMTPDAP